ncbi:SGNH/GDSL hydrolase family protein [Nostoc sp. UHCC 0252]|uniref:SGNH/GDSL hydrolase family protein n=1 Tax=Nostoc sp. UHCC 0252 TaxID=3110241 RepID=UPI002B211FCC|nr:SGNH/GDSL hydrolase family protein [Nostoc sp. UHCC 0252]MEA5603117.1 SGNH/GDSL hydrolase family protein [Nostoc sp. UHCC 0252]
MQRKKWFSRTGIAFLIFIMVVAAKFMDKTHSIAEIYVFGDSLSDTGMVFRATGGMYPPNPTYFQGRYSNGRVWIEYLAESLHLSSKQTNNFAYGGSTTGSVGNSYVPSLLNQVQSFTQTHQPTNPDALYVLWAGANDYLQGVSSATVPIKNLTTAINSLTDAGAKKILVGNLPDLGQLPATKNSSNSVNLSALTQAHNQGLRRSLKILSQQHSDIEIVQLDASALYRNAITNPADFNFTNVISSCLAGVGDASRRHRACSNPDQFLFWDGIHPTAAAHRIIGKTAFSAIQEAGMINPRSMLVP